MTHIATYSPEDNKLRMYPAHRLDADEYSRMKASGFKWAPKQELFVAPMWTPERADLMIEMCGDIEDEDKSLVERAEERADRFDDLSEKRAHDADRAHDAVAAIAENIPLGQPILIGHHSERHARKDAQRIENGMRKAVQMWESSEYWKQRASGALRNAQYKERADVRARRIKGLEADKRKQEKNKAEAEKWLNAWLKVEAMTDPEKQLSAALHVANFCWLYLPRKEGDRPDFNQCPTAHSALNNDYPNLYAPRTLAEVIDAAKATYPRTIAHCERWIAHYSNRIEYERAMLNEQGGLVTDKTGPEKGGAIKCLWSPRGGWAYIVKVNKVTVTIRHQWDSGGRIFNHNEPLDKIREVMTAAQVQEARDSGTLQEMENGIGFYLLDAAPKPAPAPAPKEPDTTGEKFQALKDTLKAGVQVVTAPQLFPTPRDLAQRVADLADIKPGMRVLEPSAGTGALLGAMGGGHNLEFGSVYAVEIDARLADRLRSEFPQVIVDNANFLECNGDIGQFDRILMNPPFINGSDIKHIQHARSMLKPGGRLVAICANGPRQREALLPMADYWEDLPSGTFSEQGTNVSTALLIIEA